MRASSQVTRSASRLNPVSVIEVSLNPAPVQTKTAAVWISATTRSTPGLHPNVFTAMYSPTRITLTKTGRCSSWTSWSSRSVFVRKVRRTRNREISRSTILATSAETPITTMARTHGKSWAS